jgi:hypothetical protein
MITLEQLRKLEPSLKDLPDDEVFRIRELIYDHAELALSCFLETKTGKSITLPTTLPFLTELPEETGTKHTNIGNEETHMRNRFTNKLSRAIEEYLLDEKILKEKLKKLNEETRS